MRAVACEAPQKMTLKELPLPVLRENEVLVRVMASAICGSDIKAYQGKHPLVKLPLTLGHEFSGVIENMGEGVTNLSKGDRVVIEPSFVCNKCFFCKEKKFHLCDNLRQLGHQLPGSFAEYTVASAPFVYAIPEHLSFEEASLTQPLAIAIHAVDRSDVANGDFAVVFGAGAIGQLIIQVSKCIGARVLAIDLFDQKLDKARKMGADYTLRGDDPNLQDRILSLTEEKGADVTFEAAGTTATIRESFKAVRKGGTILLMGLTGHKTEEVPLEEAVLRELNLVGTIRYDYGDYQKAIDLLSSERIKVKPIIEQNFSLEDTPKVFEDVLASPVGILRAVMVSTSQ